MKYYDYKKALKLLKKYKVKEITLGMKQDMFWTAESLNEKRLKEMVNGKSTLGGINGSKWATPVAVITNKEGELFVDCYYEK